MKHKILYLFAGFIEDGTEEQRGKWGLRIETSLFPFDNHMEIQKRKSRNSAETVFTVEIIFNIG